MWCWLLFATGLRYHLAFSERLASEFYVCFLVVFNLQRSLFYLPLICRFHFFNLYCWVVHFRASEYLAIDWSVLFFMRFEGQKTYCIMSFIVFSYQPKDFNLCIVLQLEGVNVSWMFFCSSWGRVSLKFHLFLHSSMKRYSQTSRPLFSCQIDAPELHQRNVYFLIYPSSPVFNLLARTSRWHKLL